MGLCGFRTWYVTQREREGYWPTYTLFLFDDYLHEYRNYLEYISFWQLCWSCAGLVKKSIRPKDYIWYGNICPKLYIKKIINKLYMNIKIKSSYIIIQRMAACFLNLDISHHYLSSYYRWRHLNELIPAILQTNKNIAMLSLFLVIGSRERWFAHEWF